jgi:hypothetical protein
MNSGWKIGAVAFGAMLLAGLLPAGADCSRFDALVTSADTGRGFEDLVPFRSFYDLRRDDLPAEQIYPGFDTCQVIDNDWNSANQHYGEAQYVCTLEPEVGASGTLTFDEAVLKFRSIGALAMAIVACVNADARFKPDRDSMEVKSFIMKPELTNMRGMYDNPRVQVEVIDLSSRITIEPSDKDPFGLVRAQGLKFTVSGIAHNFKDGPKPRAE